MEEMDANVLVEVKDIVYKHSYATYHEAHVLAFFNHVFINYIA
jgi:hypothetical protein